MLTEEVLHAFTQRPDLQPVMASDGAQGQWETLADMASREAADRYRAHGGGHKNARRAPLATASASLVNATSARVSRRQRNAHHETRSAARLALDRD